MEGLFIREIALADAEAAAQLCEELGYPASIDAIRKRIAALQTLPDHMVYVICTGDMVIGWIDVRITQHLQTEPFGEIGGLVVSSAYRSRGVGQKLLAHAEHWIADQGITDIVVRSRITRESAHRFYLREGYSLTKTSAVFSKTLDGAVTRPTG
jgi:GNAT superfamily N-acetyltransferase